MFETSSVNQTKRKFHPLTFLISVTLHVAAIALITFVTVWDVEMPARSPDQITAFRLSPVLPAPPPPKIIRGDPEGTRELPRDPETEPVQDEFRPVETPVLDPSDAADVELDGDDVSETSEPFGHPEGDPAGDPDGDLAGVDGGVAGGTGDDLSGFPSDTPYDIVGGVIAPAITHRVEPVYPPLLHRIGTAGFVQIECIISKDGQLRDIQVIRASHPLFADSAIRAVKQWRFTPGTFHGRAVSTRFVFSVNFNVAK